MTNEHSIATFYHHAFPMQAALVTCNDEEKNTNIITVAWHTSLSKQPPLYGISIAPTRHSHILIQNSKEFVINFLSFTYVDHIHFCGTHSGKTQHKQQHTPFTFQPSTTIQTPGITQAYARLECKLAQTIRTGDHTFFIGEVHHVSRNEQAFDNDILQLGTIQPTWYLGNNIYTDGKQIKHC